MNIRYRCELCNELYEDFFDKGIIVYINGEKCNISNLYHKNKTYKLCKNCLKAILFGVSCVDNSNLKLIK